MSRRSVFWVGAALSAALPGLASAQAGQTDQELAKERDELTARIALINDVIAKRKALATASAELAKVEAAAAPAGADDKSPAAGAQQTGGNGAVTPGAAGTGNGGNGTAKFGGLEFGLGVAFTYDLGHRDRIKQAQVVNNIVRATEVENLRARIVFESHYLFTPKGNLFGLDNDGKDRRNWGLGPFVAFQGGTDEVIQAIGAGLMLGFRRQSDDPKATDSFNIGIGVMYDLSAQVLGDGILENQPLPPGETEVRYRNQSQSGLLVMTSYSF